MSLATIEYPVIPLREVRVLSERSSLSRKPVVSINIRGEQFAPTARFWQSMFRRFRITDNIFRYFTHEEVFQRIVERSPDDRLRLCVERRPQGAGQLLGVSSPKRSLLTFEQGSELLGRYRDEKGAGPVYHGGVLTSAHVPRSGERGFDIGPDCFHNRFVVEAPIDGLGQPRIYLSLRRQICSNGAVAYSKAFRSDIRIGDDAVYTLERALGHFDHEEGFAALRQRFESAQKSWASLQEAIGLQRVLRIGGASYLKELDSVCGDLHALYGLANLESLSTKRQRVLPARCRVYDLLNFASEIATHRATPDCRFRLHAYIGGIISEEYDLEGTAEKVSDFKDLFLGVN